MAQVGGRQRAEATDKALTTLRAELAAVQPLVTHVRVLEARIQATEGKVASLEAELARVKAAAVTPAPTA
jgi:hypothetical protein